MSGLFGSITIPGNRLTEFAAQTAAVGIPIPFGFGQFPCDGNIGFAPMPPKEHVTKKKQGKGGVKTTEYSYTLSYAIMFCEGPIYGYLTITRAGKVVYTTDPNATVEDAAYAAKWAQKATFYYGTETQLPDSTIESYKGSGNVSAFRGIAYIVVEDDDVTDNGGAVPPYSAIIIGTPPEAYLTSLPYPVLIEEPVSFAFTPIDGELRTIMLETEPTLDRVTVSLSPVSGMLRLPFIQTDSEDSKLQFAMQPQSGELKNPLKAADSQDHKAQLALTPQTGVLDERLISSNPLVQKLQFGLVPQSGSLA